MNTYNSTVASSATYRYHMYVLLGTGTDETIDITTKTNLNKET